jgi:UDP:flavonoid glycosyltransferase YjiC (YdhE family)
MFSNIISSFYFGRIHELTAYRKSHGIQDPVDLLHPIMGTSTMLIASSPEIEYPMVIPSNVLPCGPIVSKPEPLSTVDADLASWLAAAPTVLVNLGSHAEYDSEKVQRFARMVTNVLAHSDVQILWKLDRNTAEFPSDRLSGLEHVITHRRLRIVDWIPGDVSSLLDSGRIVCAVHHGGANSFHEPLA